MPDLADIVRGEGAQYLQTHFATPTQQKALRDIAGCRTEAMGIVPGTCDDCGETYRSFQSCGNRSCPQCQAEARAKWLAARTEELLPVPYLHVVFNVPREFRELALRWPRECYEAVMRSVGATLIRLGRSLFDVQLGCLIQLHTWGQNLAQHIHCHCLVPCGGFSDDGKRWVPFEPTDLRGRDLAREFRLFLCRGVREAARAGKFGNSTAWIDDLLARVATRKWQVYARPPYGGPEKLLAYLAKNMYRVAISNNRIESYEGHAVTFTCRDYRNGDVVKRCTLEGQEFVRRFVQHVPPRGFVRMRSYGFLGNRDRKKNVERARQLIGKTVASRRSEELKPVRLCPSCYARRHPELVQSLVPSVEVISQLSLELRPPPQSTAA